MNTKISYQYMHAWDAKGETTTETVIVGGMLSEKHIKEIVECLEERRFFYPEPVGFPVYAPYKQPAWCILTEDSFLSTDETPTVTFTAMELLYKFKAAKGKWIPDAKPNISFSKRDMENFMEKYTSDYSWSEDHVPEQLRSLYTAYCYIFDVEVDSCLSDWLLGIIYDRGKLDDIITYEDFEDFMSTYLV